MNRLKTVWGRFSASPVWRAWTRYAESRGNLLAGGVTYFSFFSIFPAVALAFTIFGLVLRDQPGLLDQIREAIDTQLPGFVQSEDGSTGLIPIAIPSGQTLGLTAAIGLGGLLWAGLGWLGALRDGVRQIFGAKGAPGNFALAKLRDLGVLCTLGVGVVLVAAVNAIANSMASRVAEAIGLGDQGWIITGVGLLMSALANMLLVALMLRVLSGVDLPNGALRNGAVFGGIAMTILQTFGTRLIAGTMSNPLFGSIALVVGLLAFLNFIARAMLMSAAWAAVDVETVLGSDASEGEAAKLTEGPPSRVEAAPDWVARGSALPTDDARRVEAGLPTLSTRSADRASIAAGAVLGATAAALAGAGLRGARLLTRRR